MNWLILCDNPERSAAAVQILRACGKTGTVLSFLLGSGSSEKITPLITQADGCVVITDRPEVFSNELAFTAGYCAGRSVPGFAAGISCSEHLLPGFCCVPDEQSLFDRLKTVYAALQKSTEKKEAFASLFNRGIPFSADCFASYIAKDNREVCSKYTAAGMSVNSKTSDGVPLLNVAVRNQQESCVKWLIESGADINAVANDRGYTAVMDAVWCGNESLVKLLIERGAKLNTVSKEGQTMLVLAVGAGKKNICNILVTHGEDPDHKDAMGMSAYEYAKLFRRDDIVDILKKYHKAD